MRQRLVGYWQVIESLPLTERLASLEYDYLCLDAQHGTFTETTNSLMALDAGARLGPKTTAGFVRVPGLDLAAIGRALDGGAIAVVVPLIDSPEEAQKAAAACRYASKGNRSYGPLRAGLRVGPSPRASDEQVLCIVMIETLGGLNHIDQILAVDGVDGIYVGPADLSMALGGEDFGDPAINGRFAEALMKIVVAGAAAGKPVGIHTSDAVEAAAYLEQGFTFVSIADDLTHLTHHAQLELAQLHR